MFRVGKGHWLKATVLGCLISMGRYSRNLRGLLDRRKGVEPVISSRSRDILRYRVWGFQAPQTRSEEKLCC